MLSMLFQITLKESSVLHYPHLWHPTPNPPATSPHHTSLNRPYMQFSNFRLNLRVEHIWKCLCSSEWTLKKFPPIPLNNILLFWLFFFFYQICAIMPLIWLSFAMICLTPFFWNNLIIVSYIKWTFQSIKKHLSSICHAWKIGLSIEHFVGH